MSHSKLFVQIASYEDPDVINTVASLYKTAADPEKISVGICLQENAQHATNLTSDLRSLSSSIRIKAVVPEASGGACWARAEAMSMLKDETYVLQIDSHTRFVSGWDSILDSLIAAAPNRRAVISTYPSGFSQVDFTGQRRPCRIVARGFDEVGALQFDGVELTGSERGGALISGAFVGGCFIFAERAFFEECPPMPDVPLRFEEESLAVRSYLHLWNVYHPREHIVFHKWNRGTRRNAQAAPQGTAARTWWRQLGVAAGREKTLDDFEKFSGVNFATFAVTRRALRGEFS